jgi:signal transduction histidine kinase/ActR/RegA family two-component response regulator
MSAAPGVLFDAALWRPAIEKYSAVTHLSVALYGIDGARVAEPAPATSLLAFFDRHRFDPGLFERCARRCLDHTGEHPAVVVEDAYSLGVVGTPLVLDGAIVGAAVAGYVFVEFCQSEGVGRLSRAAAVSFAELWALARQQHPIPARRLVLYGELLRVLGDTLLRENDRTRKHEETAGQLTEALAAKNQFLAVLSHELRTPLTPILGWARMLKTGASAAQIGRAAEVIERNALLQLRLVEDLLELNRAAQGKLTLELSVQCLGDAVRAAIDAVADTALKSNIGLEFTDAASRLCVQGDGDRLQQLFRNILVNALKFTPAGGTIGVTLSSEGERGVVTIRDSGRGIAPEFLPFVFDLFKQQEGGTRRTHGGLGIGLALVKALTEAHGGTVAVASAGLDHGTVVTIRLPLVADPGIASAPNESDDLRGLRELHGLRILIVEDIDDTREAMCATLERLGAEVTAATDGTDALKRLAIEPADLVLCDLNMPRMDGFEFLRALRGVERDTHHPVIAVSGLASSADHRRTSEAGFEAHVDKPFDDTRLLTAIGEVMSRRRTA